MCTNSSPVLSGAVQNAPGSTSVRGEDDTSGQFGLTGASYSGADAAIWESEITSNLANPTHTEQIAESNLAGSGYSSQSNTLVQSGTILDLVFVVTEDGGTFQVTFNADLDVLASVTGGDVGKSTVVSSLSVNLSKQGGGTVVSWAPTGGQTVGNCGAGYTCSATESNTDLEPNVTRISSGGDDAEQGSGSFSLTVTGLTTGIYNLGLGASGSVNLTREVPVPGTLPLLGIGLLFGAQILRRK